MPENPSTTNGKQFTEVDLEINKSFQNTKAWINYLLRNWIIILVLGFAGGIVGIFYAKNKPLQYKSFLTFSLDEARNNGGGGLSSLVAQFGFGSNDDNIFSGDNIVEVIKSRTILERVLLSSDTMNGIPITMIDYYFDIQNTSKKSVGKPGYFPVNSDPANLSYTQDSVLYYTQQEILQNNLGAIRPDKQLNIYVLSFKSQNERYTKVFTDKILSETIKFYTELKTKKAESTLSVLEQQVAMIKGNLNTSISNKATTQDANVNPAFSGAQVPLQKQQVNVQVYGAAYGELYKHLLLARYQLLQDIPLLQVISENKYPMTKVFTSKIKYGLIGACLIGLLSIFTLTIIYMIKKKK